jgi:hypothetical protein
MSISPFAQKLLRAGLQGLAGEKFNLLGSATKNQFEQAQNDWRVRLSLAPSATYLYNASNPGILKPLKSTNGVIFPYTPSIQVAYNAAYDAQDIVHSNYKIYQYKNSSVDSVTITGTFTAQDTNEANYLLAVLHFFKSVTKMFYGQDTNPVNGTPPPICFLSGFGSYQFNNHPVVITGFSQNLPDKVDYIRAQVESPPPDPNSNPGQNSTGDETNTGPNIIQQIARLGLALLPGGTAPKPVFSPPRPGKFTDATYVPTEMQISITAQPVMSRQYISNEFSLEKYANGSLTKQGIW